MPRDPSHQGNSSRGLRCKAPRPRTGLVARFRTGEAITGSDMRGLSSRTESAICVGGRGCKKGFSASMSHMQAWPMLDGMSWAPGTLHARCRHWICTDKGFPRFQSLNALVPSANTELSTGELYFVISREAVLRLRRCGSHHLHCSTGIRRPLSHKRREPLSACCRT